MIGPFEVVVLMRHAETEWNRANRRQGRLDSPLTTTGCRQAVRLARQVATIDIDGIYCSPLGRCVRTAEPSSAATGHPIVVVDSLKEIDHGRFSGLTTADVERIAPGSLQQRAADKYRWRFPGGESYHDADARAAHALRQIAERGSVRPLLVVHEMISRLLRRRLLNLDPASALDLDLPHGQLVSVVPANADSASRPRP